MFPGNQNFSTPDGPVRPKAGTVENNAQYRLSKTVFGHYRYRVGMVMLDLVTGKVEFDGVVAAQVIGMQIVGDDLRLDMEDPLHMPDCKLEKIIGGKILQVPDMLAQEGLVPFREADGALLLPAAPQHQADIPVQENGNRNISTGSADKPALSVDDPHDGVVAPQVDVPVVHEKIIGNLPQVFKCPECDSEQQSQIHLQEDNPERNAP